MWKMFLQSQTHLPLNFHTEKNKDLKGRSHRMTEFTNSDYTDSKPVGIQMFGINFWLQHGTYEQALWYQNLYRLWRRRQFYFRKALIEMQNATYKEMMSPSRPWNGSSQKWWSGWAAHFCLAHLNLPEPAPRKRGRVETKAWGPGTKPCCGWLDDHIHNLLVSTVPRAPASLWSNNLEILWKCSESRRFLQSHWLPPTMKEQLHPDPFRWGLGMRWPSTGSTGYLRKSFV